MEESEMRAALLSGMPANRLADLVTRTASGHLSSLEALAMSVLRGGAAGEEATPGLLDEALATYSHGGYRVPVRVVTDWRRATLVVTPDQYALPEDITRVVRALGDSLKRGVPGKAFAFPAGWRLDVYEAATPEEAGVVFKQPTNGEPSSD